MKSARGEYVRKIPSHNLLQTNYCTRNSRKNAIVLQPLRAIASHELLHELVRQQTTIAATPLAESTPSPNSQADSIPVPGHLELHDRRRYGVLLSPCFGALDVSSQI